MYDIEKKEPTRSELSKQGFRAFVYTAVGAGLVVLNSIITRLPIIGPIIGVAVCVLGIGALMSKDPTDKKMGAVITAAGALALISKIRIPVLAPIAGTLLSIGAIGLIAVGIFNAVKFIIGRKRLSE